MTSHYGDANPHSSNLRDPGHPDDQREEVPLRSVNLHHPQQVSPTIPLQIHEPQIRVPHVSLLRHGFQRLPGIKRAAQFLLLIIGIIATTAAADPNVAQSKRFDKLGHRMMCTCSCAQVLLECNHVGCPNSDGMRQELMAGVSNGDSDNTIFQSFVQKYGPTVLAAPPGTGFNIVGWVMPFAVLILGIGGTALLIRRWRLHAVPMPPPSNTPRFPAIRDQIRRETEL
jgi:cytochrome c-type biogenesis protein CcmH/NrfF